MSSIAKYLYYRNGQDSDISDGIDAGKRVVGFGGLLYGASVFASQRGFDMSDPKARVKDLKAFTSGEQSKVEQMGVRLRDDVIDTMERVDQVRSQANDRSRQLFAAQDEIDKILKGDVRERNALIQSIIDNLPPGLSTELEATRDNLYALINKEAAAVEKQSQLINQQLEAINRNTESQDALIKSFNKNRTVGHLLSGARGTFASESIGVKKSYATYSAFIRETGVESNPQVQQYLRRLQAIGGDIKGIQAIDEFEKGTSFRSGKPVSLYANVRFGSYTAPVPLQLQRDARGLSFVRTTLDFATRYQVAPILDANALNNQIAAGIRDNDAFSRIVQRGNLVENQIEFLERAHQSMGSLRNLSKAQLNYLGERLRTFAEPVSGALAGTVVDAQQVRGFDTRLMNNLAYSYLTQANKAIVLGINDIPESRRRILVPELSSMRSDIFDAPNASATMRRTLETPFPGITESFTQINLRGRDRLAPIDVFETYGMQSRVVLPVTARETQFLGRPEIFSGLVQLDSTASRYFEIRDRDVAGSGTQHLGKSKKSVISTGLAGGLFSVRNLPANASLAGMNMSGLLFTDEKAALKAGLAEGMVYSGSTPVLRRMIPKTISLTEATSKFVEDLRTRPEDFVDVKATELFRKYGRGNQIFLGSVDGELKFLPNFRSGIKYTIRGIEEIDASGKRKFTMGFQLDELALGNKLFSILGKSKMARTNINSKQALEELIMQATDIQREEASELVDLYTRQFGANLQSSIFGTIDTASKSPVYMAQLLAGGAEHHGVFLDTSTLTIRPDSTAIEENQQYISRFLERSLGQLKREGVSSKDVGLLLGGFRQLAKEEKFGFSEKEFERIVGGVGFDSVDEVMEYSNKNVVFGGAAVFAGTPGSILRDNLASFEPRVANYLAENLRTIHGMPEEDVVSYVNNLLARKENIGQQSKLLNIYGLMTETMSPLADKAETDRKIANLIEGGEATRLDALENEQLARVFASGEEDSVRRALGEIGEPTTRAAILNIDDFVRALIPGTNAEEVSRFLKTNLRSDEILLPAGKTIDQLSSFEIRTQEAGKKINIEKQFTRTLVDFGNLLMRGGIDPEVLGGETYKSVMRSLVGPTGVMIRNVFSGKIAGSGSFNPEGLIIGRTVSSTNRKIGENIQKVSKLTFEHTKGKVIFGDITVFANLMDDFRTAVELTPGFKDLDEEGVKKLEREMVSDFLFTPFRILDMERTGRSDSISKLMKDYSVSVLGKRDPVLGPSHLMPNLNLINLDLGTKFNLITGDKSIRSGYHRQLAKLFNAAHEIMNQTGRTDTQREAQILERVFGEGFAAEDPLSEKDTKAIFERLKGQKVSIEDIYRLTQVEGLEKRTGKFAVSFFRNVLTEGVGAGSVQIPEFHASIQLESQGKAIAPISSRMDYFKFAIGDFDGDIVSLFLDFKKNIQSAASDISMVDQYKYGAKFVTINEMISSAMKDVGRRLNVGSLTPEEFMFHKTSQEEILKSVGGLDTQVKTGVLGTALSFDKMSIDEKGTVLSFMATAQEVLNIKTKKLPVASPIADYFATSLARAYETGRTDDLEIMLRTLFRDSDLSKGVEIKGVGFDTSVHGTSSVFDEISKASSGQRVSVDDIIKGAKVMVESVRRFSLDALKSDNVASRLMASRDVSNANLFRALAQDSDLLETAFLSEDPNEINRAFRTIEKNLDMSPSRLTQGKSGAAIAGILGASYLLSSFTTPGSFVPENAFSDYKVQNAMKLQNVVQASQRADSNISPDAILPRPHKEIIGRQINSGQYYSQEQTAINAMGKVPSLEQAYGVSSIIGRSGGRGMITINDTRMPITGNYIDRMMGE